MSGTWTATITENERCDHDTGWWTSVYSRGMYKGKRVRIFVCEKCHTVLYGEQLKRYNKRCGKENE
jgi:hypothetical protein